MEGDAAKSFSCAYSAILNGVRGTPIAGQSFAERLTSTDLNLGGRVPRFAMLRLSLLTLRDFGHPVLDEFGIVPVRQAPIGNKVISLAEERRERSFLPGATFHRQ